MVIELSLCKKTVSMLNIFKFDAFSFTHSLSQTGTDITLLTIWLITQDHRFLQKMLKKKKNVCLTFLLIIYSYSFKSSIKEM